MAHMTIREYRAHIIDNFKILIIVIKQKRKNNMCFYHLKMAHCKVATSTPMLIHKMNFKK